MIPTEADTVVASTDTGAITDQAPKRGRRLSADRSDIILGTVLNLLKEVGYDQLRMQDVADRAGVGLSTIYRRWPTKQDVVRAALTCEQASEKFITTGDARADVKSCLAELAQGMTGDSGQTILGLLTTLRSDPEVGDVFRETMINRLQDHLRDLIASELGEDFPDLDLRATAGPAIIFYQAAVCGHSFDVDEMAERLTNLLFAPAPA